MDFYACVQAKKRKNSPHGRNETRPPDETENEIRGKEFKPINRKYGPYYR